MNIDIRILGSEDAAVCFPLGEARSRNAEMGMTVVDFESDRDSEVHQGFSGRTYISTRQKEFEPHFSSK